MSNSKYEKVKSDITGQLVGNFGKNYKAKYKEYGLTYDKNANQNPDGTFKKNNKAKEIAKGINTEEKKRMSGMFKYYITDKKFKQLADKAFDMAINGDREMLKYVLDRMMGKEGQQSTLDVSVTENKIEWKYSFDATEDNTKSINSQVINPELPIIDAPQENSPQENSPLENKESSDVINKEEDNTTPMNE